MADPNLQPFIENAVADVIAFGRHWLPDERSDEIADAVRERLPKRLIIKSEPRPWDEHVIVDMTDDPLTDSQLTEIAEERLRLRGLNSGSPLPI